MFVVFNMNTEYHDHYDWVKKETYTREGNNGRHYPEPINFTEPKQEWKPNRITPNGEKFIYERMQKVLGSKKSMVEKKEEQNPYMTSYQDNFRAERNYLHNVPAYLKAAQVYADEMNKESNDKQDMVLKNKEEPEELGKYEKKEAEHNTNFAVKKLYKDLNDSFLARKINLPVIDPKERYQRYRSFLDK